MPNKLLTNLDARKVIDLAFVLFVFFLSLIPLFPWKGWDGYAPGTFIYQDEIYYVRYSDEKMGADKPHIFFLEGWPVRIRTDIIEFSDIHTRINSMNLYRDWESFGRLDDNGLKVKYSSNNMTHDVTKEVSSDSQGITVRYISNEPVEWTLTFWRWYFTSVDDRDFRGVVLPIKIVPKKTLSFEFGVQGRNYQGYIDFSSEPTNIEVWKDQRGLNKILVEFEGSDISVKVYLKGSGTYVFNLADKDLLFPLLAGVFGLIYLRVGRYAVMVKTCVDRSNY